MTPTQQNARQRQQRAEELAAADSRSYSLVTWCAWVVANASMTLSIYEASGRKVDHLVLVNICNTLMCLATTLVILYLR